MSNQPNLKTILNRIGAAEYLGISLRTIDELISNGSLRVVRIGRSVRFRAESLEEFLEANETAGKPSRRRAKRVTTPTAAKQ